MFDSKITHGNCSLGLRPVGIGRVRTAFRPTRVPPNHGQQADPRSRRGYDDMGRSCLRPLFSVVVVRRMPQRGLPGGLKCEHGLTYIDTVCFIATTMIKAMLARYYIKDTNETMARMTSHRSCWQRQQTFSDRFPPHFSTLLVVQLKYSFHCSNAIMIAPWNRWSMMNHFQPIYQIHTRTGRVPLTHNWIWEGVSRSRYRYRPICVNFMERLHVKGKNYVSPSKGHWSIEYMRWYLRRFIVEACRACGKFSLRYASRNSGGSFCGPSTLVFRWVVSTCCSHVRAYLFTNRDFIPALIGAYGDLY